MRAALAQSLFKLRVDGGIESQVNRSWLELEIPGSPPPLPPLIWGQCSPLHVLRGGLRLGCGWSLKGGREGSPTWEVSMMAMGPQLDSLTVRNAGLRGSVVVTSSFVLFVRRWCVLGSSPCPRSYSWPRRWFVSNGHIEKPVCGMSTKGQSNTRPGSKEKAGLLKPVRFCRIVIATFVMAEKRCGSSAFCKGLTRAIRTGWYPPPVKQHGCVDSSSYKAATVRLGCCAGGGRRARGSEAGREPTVDGSSFHTLLGVLG